METGKTSGRINKFRFTLDRCPTVEGDMRFVIISAKARPAIVWVHDKSYLNLSDHESLKATVEELGPYDKDTLQQKKSKMFYENLLLPYEQSWEFPSILQFGDIFLRTDQFACLEASDNIILQNALYCKALDREIEIAPLWDGVIDEAKLLPTSESLFWSFALALETAAAAGDREVRHSISSGLRKGSEMLRARKLTTGPENRKSRSLKGSEDFDIVLPPYTRQRMRQTLQVTFRNVLQLQNHLR